MTGKYEIKFLNNERMPKRRNCLLRKVLECAEGVYELLRFLVLHRVFHFLEYKHILLQLKKFVKIFSGTSF